MKCLGNNIQFVVQPTLNDGMNVSVAWRLEWNTPNVLLGKGFGFYTCHIYQGKAVIRNVEMFMEPLLHIEPLRLKMMGVVLTVMDKIGLYDAAFNGKVKKAIYLLLILPLMTALLFLFVKLFGSDDFDVNGDNSAQLLAAANAANNAQAIITTLLEEYENIFDTFNQAFGGDDSDVGSPRINLTATAKSNPPVDSQSLRESDIQLNEQQGQQNPSGLLFATTLYCRKK
ncbi:hypothetical protein HYC85_017219 [Camellia sinensis]|uniref:Uncharacterized protein n=1 Tax=Camellia sinensis TaxID=4442 RepID=A0A7J7H430_CAMSI|nr:hypothetical protein HYC85_017219 [Camellia sinensis]